jgi:hypothetical protein
MIFVNVHQYYKPSRYTVGTADHHSEVRTRRSAMN